MRPHDRIYADHYYDRLYISVPYPGSGIPNYPPGSWTVSGAVRRRHQRQDKEAFAAMLVATRKRREEALHRAQRWETVSAIVGALGVVALIVVAAAAF